MNAMDPSHTGPDLHPQMNAMDPSHTGLAQHHRLLLCQSVHAALELKTREISTLFAPFLVSVGNRPQMEILKYFLY
jgi:hypothetical protein